MQYSVTIQGLDKIQASFAKAPQLTLQESAKAVNKSLIGYQATAKQLAPVDTSRLRSSISITPASINGSTVTGSVGTGVKYAEAQEGGSGIYGPTKSPIRPKRAKVLVFNVNGKQVFAKQVKGVKGRFFMKGSLTANQSRTDGFFEQAAQAVANQLEGGK